MGDQLPVSDPETIKKCQDEYLDLSRRGHPDAADACFRFAWALCHSADRSENKRGVKLAETALTAMAAGSQSTSSISDQEFVYVRAVGLFNVRNYHEARALCKEMLQKSAAFRQAATLKDIIEKEMVKEGLIGVGVGSVAIGVLAGVLALALKKR